MVATCRATVTDRASSGGAARRGARATRSAVPAVSTTARALRAAAAAGAAVSLGVTGVGGCVHREPAAPLVVDRPAGIIVEQRIAGPAWRFDEAATRGLAETGGRRRSSAGTPRSFSEAVAAFDFDAALKFAVVRRLHGDAAGGDAEQRLVEALRLAVEGSEAADSALTETMRTSPDTLVKRVARLALTATLQYRGKWSALAELPPVDGDGENRRDASYAASGVTAERATGARARVADTVVVGTREGVTPFAPGDSGGAGVAHAAMSDPDAKASVERWARAYRGMPDARYDFPSKPVVLPLTLSPSGTPVVPVTVNGRTFLFWLDTGSSLTILSADAAAAALAPAYGTDTLEVVTATGRVAARPAVVASLAMGGLAVRDLPAMIVDGNALSLPPREPGAAPTKVDGIVGFDVIRRMDLELNYATGKATIRRPSKRDDAGNRRNLFWLGYPVVRLTAQDGRPVHFALDTGADETYAALPLLVKTRARTVAAERRRVSGFGQTLSVRGHVIPSLRLTLRETPLRFERVFVYVVEYPTLFTLDGTLGGDVGAGGVVRIDMTNGIFAVGGRR